MHPVERLSGKTRKSWRGIGGRNGLLVKSHSALLHPWSDDKRLFATAPGMRAEFYCAAWWMGVRVWKSQPSPTTAMQKSPRFRRQKLVKAIRRAVQQWGGFSYDPVCHPRLGQFERRGGSARRCHKFFGYRPGRTRNTILDFINRSAAPERETDGRVGQPFKNMSWPNPG